MQHGTCSMPLCPIDKLADHSQKRQIVRFSDILSELQKTLYTYHLSEMASNRRRLKMPGSKTPDCLKKKNDKRKWSDPSNAGNNIIFHKLFSKYSVNSGLITVFQFAIYVDILICIDSFRSRKFVQNSCSHLCYVPRLIKLDKLTIQLFCSSYLFLASKPLFIYWKRRVSRFRRDLKSKHKNI